MIAGLFTLAKANPQTVRFTPIRHFPGQTELMDWCAAMGVGTAILLVVAGVVFLLFGFKWFKPLVTLNALVLGGYVGAIIGQQYGSALIGGCFGCIIFSALTLWLTKWAVAVMGGIVGAILGASLWRASGLETQYAWAGAMTGLVGFGLFSFILFRGSVIMYTSLQGAAMFIVGLLGVALKYQASASAVSEGISAYRIMLPAAVFLPAMIGLMYQQFWGGAGGGGGAAPAGDKKK